MNFHHARSVLISAQNHHLFPNVAKIGAAMEPTCVRHNVKDELEKVFLSADAEGRATKSCYLKTWQ